MDIKNKRYKRIQSLIQNCVQHVHSEPAQKQKIALYKISIALYKSDE